MNVFKTFEIFLKEPLSVLKKSLVQIVSLETDNIFERKSSLDVSITNNKAQITVVNNKKLYNLLSLVTYRAKMKENAQKDKEVKSGESA